MAIYNFPSEAGRNFSIGGEEVLRYITSEIPHLIDYTLFAIFMIIWLGGYNYSKNRDGKSEAMLWFLIAGLFGMITSIILSLVGGFVSTTTLIIFIAITITGSMLYLLSDR